MLLFEDLQDLHKIDMNLLQKFFTEASYTRANLKEKMESLYRTFGIGNNSKIYIEPLKNQVVDGNLERRHTWKYATENVLDKEDVAGFIVRSNKRQLFAVFKRSGDYYYAYNDLVEDLNGANDFFEKSVYRTGAITSIRNKMSKVVKAFIETYPNAKKNWDLLVIEKDKNVEQKRTDRFAARKNMEYKPHDKEYGDYIRTLKNNLSIRLEKFINDKLPNNITPEQLKELVTNASNIFVKKIKIAGFVYSLTDTSSDISRSIEKLDIICTYTPSIDPFGNAYNYSRYGNDNIDKLRIVYETVGKEIRVKELYFPNSGDFEIGIANILDTIDKIKAKNQS